MLASWRRAVYSIDSGCGISSHIHSQANSTSGLTLNHAYQEYERLFHIDLPVALGLGVFGPSREAGSF